MADTIWEAEPDGASQTHVNCADAQSPRPRRATACPLLPTDGWVRQTLCARGDPLTKSREGLLQSQLWLKSAARGFRCASVFMRPLSCAGALSEDVRSPPKHQHAWVGVFHSEEGREGSRAAARAPASATPSPDDTAGQAA